MAGKFLVRSLLCETLTGQQLVGGELPGLSSPLCPPAVLLLPPALLAGNNIIWYRISLWSAGVSCPVCVPS